MDQFTLMEQEHELAKQYFNAYFEAVERNSQPVKGPEAHEMASYLLQAFTLLNHHFKMEEEIISSLADRSNAIGF